MPDERDELLQEMWDKWKPYNEGQGGKWRSYVVSSNEASLLETEADCVTVVKSERGLYVA
jgi:hypothetical protein